MMIKDNEYSGIAWYFGADFYTLPEVKNYND